MTNVLDEEIALAPDEEPDQRPSRGRRVARAIRRWYGWLLIGVASMWLVYTVVRRLTTGRWHWSLLLDATPPIFLVAVPALLLVASAAACGTRRSWAAVIALAGLLPGIDQAGVNGYAVRGGLPPVPAGAIHVVSWNTSYWGMSNADPEAQYRLLKRQPADVYLLQEHVIWDPVAAAAGTTDADAGYSRLDDDAKLRAEFPGYYIARRSELLTISRYPIVDQPIFGPAAEVPPDAPFNTVFARDKVLRTDLLIGDRRVSIYNVHITVQTAIDLDFFSNKINVDRYYQRKFRWREAEMRGLVDDLVTNPYPSLVSGDFNSTSAMRSLDPLRAVATDATYANRQLLPLSWRYDAPMNFRWHNPLAGLPLPFWRIDWTFTRGPVAVHRYELQSAERLSDHRVQDLWISLS